MIADPTKLPWSDRMRTWFTWQMMAPNEALMEALEQIAKEYDDAQAAGTLTTGKIDELFAKSDKIQAELWRRVVNNADG